MNVDVNDDVDDDVDDDFDFDDIMDKIASNPLAKAMMEGIPLKNLISVDLSELIENFYALASSLYNDGEYKKASPIFGILCFLDYNDPRFSMGVGACMQCLKYYEQAILSYSHGVMLNVDDPKAAFHAGECCLAIDDTERAIPFYEKAVASTNKDDRSKDLRKRSSHILKILKKGKK